LTRGLVDELTSRQVDEIGS